MARHRLESAPDINAQDRTPDDVVREIIEHTSLLEELHAQGMTKDSLYFKSTLNQLKELRNEFAYHAGLSLESEATAPTGKRAIELPRDNEIDETPVLDELLAEYGLDENYSDITVKQTGRHTTEQIDDTPIDSSPIYDQLLMERALEAAGPAPTIPPKPANPPVVPANGELSPAPKLETKATLDSSHESTDATDKAPALQTSASLELPEDSKDQVPELRTTATLESSDDNDESAPELKTTATLDMSDDNDMLAPALVTTATLESSEFDKPKLRDRLKKRFNAWRENRTIDSPERTTEEKHERRRRGTVKALATLAGLALLATGITQSQKEGSGNDTTPTPDPFEHSNPAAADATIDFTMQAKTPDVVAPTDIPGSSPTYDIPVKYTENTPEPVSLRAGAGGEQLMKSIGKDPHDWYAVADTVAQKFPDYFYTTTLDDGTIDTRIARKGAVPEPIIAYLQKHTK